MVTPLQQIRRLLRRVEKDQLTDLLVLEQAKCVVHHAFRKVFQGKTLRTAFT